MRQRKSNVKKRYCKDCDGINSGGFYDDICMVQEINELSDKYYFDEKDIKTGNYQNGCQVPAKVWRELQDLYCGRFGSSDYGGFTICEALKKQSREKEIDCT